MNKPFDSEKAKAGHPVVMETACNTVFTRVRYVGERVNLGSATPPLIFEIHPTGQIFSASFEGVLPDGVRLFLDCPDELRTICVEELPRLILVRPHQTDYEMLVTGFSFVNGLRIGNDWVLLRDLVKSKYEFRDATKNSSWQKFEVPV